MKTKLIKKGRRKQRQTRKTKLRKRMKTSEKE